MIGVTGHFLDTDYNYHSLVIIFKKFSGQHIGTRIRHFLKKELNLLGIKDKISSITTDNGADIKKATKGLAFGERYPCFAHVLNLIISAGFGFWKKT